MARKLRGKRCHYLVVGGDGTDYVAGSKKEALRLADHVGGAAYVTCPVKTPRGLRWRRTRVKAW